MSSNMSESSEGRLANRKFWRDYYIKRYNKTHNGDAAILAMWYDFLILAFGENK